MLYFPTALDLGQSEIEFPKIVSQIKPSFLYLVECRVAHLSDCKANVERWYQKSGIIVVAVLDQVV